VTAVRGNRFLAVKIRRVHRILLEDWVLNRLCGPIPAMLADSATSP
jgi:hypothetical protein